MKDSKSREELGKERDKVMVNLLKPCSTSIDGFEASPPPLDLKALSLSVYFTGWRLTRVNFKSWATKMAISYTPIWREAGIFEAVMASTARIHKDIDLVLSVAEKWCPNTNTFVFPWGETTITLEDVMVLLDFSVLGSPVFAALDSEGEKIKAKLLREWSKVAKDHKLSFVTLTAWMKRFEGCGDELEHVAFLVLWLSYSVFPSRFFYINKGVFAIAVHLSKGTRIALAPAVLAHLYADLSILKTHIRDFTISKDIGRIELKALFKLVQVWTWERFRELQPVPNPLVNGEPRLSLWHNLQHKTREVRRILDSSKLTSFEWRPYTKTVENWEFPQFYPKKAMFVPVDPNLDDEFVSFARCSKVSQLVGIGCVEHYFPDRVASQFGMIQDVPGPFKRSKLSEEAAWTDYNKPTDDLTIYIPSRSAVPCDYPMYDWWKSFPEFKCYSEGNLVVDKCTMGCCQKQVAKDNAEDDVSTTIAQKISLKSNKYSEVKNSKGESSESLVERSSFVPDINDSGSCQNLDLIRADRDEIIQPPEKDQGNKETSEIGSKSGKNMVMIPIDENNSSDPPLGFDGAINIVGSPPETRQTSEDELDVFGRNVENMTVIDDGSKEPSCLFQECGAKVIEKASSGEKEVNATDDNISMDDGSKEPECLLPEDGVIAGENVSLGDKKEDAVDVDSLIRQKLALMEPSPCQKLANESDMHIAGGNETQGQDCLHNDNALGSEETRKMNEQLEDLEKRDDVGDDSYEKSLLKLQDSFEESSHKLKRLESTIDELMIKAERDLAWLKEQRQGN